MTYHAREMCTSHLALEKVEKGIPSHEMGPIPFGYLASPTVALVVSPCNLHCVLRIDLAPKHIDTEQKQHRQSIT